MHQSLFSLAAALTVYSLVTMASAGVAGLSPRGLDKRFLCIGDTWHEIFTSVGMDFGSEAAENDIDDFCRSWIDIPFETEYYQTTTPTSTFFPSTVTVASTTGIVVSATSTVTVTVSELNYSLTRRNHVRKDHIQGRGPIPMVTPRAALPPRMVLKARQEADEEEEEFDLASLGEALSSACSCKMVSPSTTYLISTAPAVIRTIGATFFQTVTLNNTIAGGVTTVTETVNVTSTIRPTGTDGGSSGIFPTGSANNTISGTGTDGESSGIFPTGSANHTISGTGTGFHTLPTYSHSQWNHSLPGHVNSSGWAHPTHHLDCSGVGRNVTATVTAFSTETAISTQTAISTETATFTETILSTIIDVHSAFVYRNQTETVTLTEGTVTTDIHSAVVYRNQTVTVTQGTVTVTVPGASLSLNPPTATDTADLD